MSLASTSPILKLSDLTIRFGGLTAVDRVNISLGSNDLVGIIGPNGAGKTTIFNMVTGLYQPSEGAIELENSSIVGMRPAHITQAGIARTFQNIRLFNELTVLDNVRLARHSRTSYSLLASIFRTKGFHQEEAVIKDRAVEILKLFKLEKKSHLLARQLPYGEQRRLEIARALATDPKVLLLDEPAAGMNPNETMDLAELIKWIHDEFKIATLLIEHDMKLVMNTCQRIYVVDHGVLIAHGCPNEIQNNPKVVEAYLGTSESSEKERS